MYLKNPAKFTNNQLESVPDPVPFFILLSDCAEALAFPTA
jgi:hypothetical protein